MKCRPLLRLVMLVATQAQGLQAQSLEPPAPSPDAAERPGLFRFGSLYLTPYLHVGTLGIDTNVFYTATDRQTDFTASGGPGLEVVLPFARASRLSIDGGIEYLYFAKTESQRHLDGYGTATLDLRGVKTRFVVAESYETTFTRPNFEVNERVQQTNEETRALLRRDLGERARLVVFGSRLRTETDSQFYLGTNLGNTLTNRRYMAGGEGQLGLSIKTRLVAGAEEVWYRYPNLPERDGRSTLVYSGLRTDDTALIGGSAVVGMRWFELDSGAKRDVVYANVNATWNISFKTKLGGIYFRDIDYSSLATVGDSPTNLNEAIELFLEKFLTRSVYLRVFARRSRLNSDGELVIVLPDNTVVIEQRKDRVREAGGEIGYQFRTRIRAGIKVSYTDRESTVKTFGVEGLLAGFTLQYNPPQPTFR